jgi:predicted DNA-binding transcriptional regulator AlpA
MSEPAPIPFEKRWLSAEDIGELLGRDRRYVLERMACRPDFPKPDRTGRPRWLAGEVMAWQIAARDSQQARRRRSSKP